MQIKITEDKKNNLFNRREIKGIVSAEKIPSREELLKTLSLKFSAPTENIKINKILSFFGSRNFVFDAKIYNSEKEKNSLETKKKKEAWSEKKNVEKAS